MRTLIAIAILACGLQAEKGNPAFEQMKKLEGTWEGTDTDHAEKVTYKLSARGSVLVETMSMGNHGEMITMYHPDGDDLVLTHYCMLANQPRMRAAKDQKPGSIRFVFDGATNLKPGDKHMHALTVTFIDADHLRQEWSLYDGDKEQSVVTINLSRQLESE